MLVTNISFGCADGLQVNIQVSLIGQSNQWPLFPPLEWMQCGCLSKDAYMKVIVFNNVMSYHVCDGLNSPFLSVPT